MKGLLKKSVIALAFAGALTFAGCTKDYSEDIKAVQDAHNKDVTDLNSKISALQSLLDAAKGDLSAKEAELKSLIEAVQKHEAECDAAIKVAYEKAAADAKVAAIEAAVKQAKQYADATFLTKEDADAAIAKIDAAIKDLQNGVTTNAGKIAALELGLAEAVKTIDALGDDFKQHLADVEVLKKEIQETIELYAENLQTQISQNTALSQKNEEDIKALQDMMEQIPDYVESEIALVNQYIKQVQSGHEADIKDLDEKIDNAILSLRLQLNNEVQTLNAMIDYNGQLIAGNTAAIDSIFNTVLPALENNLIAYVDAGLSSVNQYCQQLQKITEALGNDIDDLKLALETEEAARKAADKAIEDKVDALVAKFAVIGHRLTSISLIPEAYLNGIPVIELSSFLYQQVNMPANDAAKVAATAPYTRDKDTLTTSDKVTNIRYHISPEELLIDDIDAEGVAYVVETATQINDHTKGFVNEEVIVVDSVKINTRKELEVSVHKNENAKVNLGQNQITTAALKVPIAKKNLVEGEDYANVYSEYSRFTEIVTTPMIGLAELPTTSNPAAANQPYVDVNGTPTFMDTLHYHNTYKGAHDTIKIAPIILPTQDVLDLNKIVTGCYEPSKGANHKELTIANLNAAGLEFVYALIDDNSVGYKNSKIDGTNLSCNLQAGYVEHGLIGEQFVVEVQLIDTNNKNAVVDVRYILFEYTFKKQNPNSNDYCGNNASETALVIDLGADTLGCNTVAFNLTPAMLWDSIVKPLMPVVIDSVKTAADSTAQTLVVASYGDPNNPNTNQGFYVPAGVTNNGTITNYTRPVKYNLPNPTWVIDNATIQAAYKEFINNGATEYPVSYTFAVANSATSPFTDLTVTLNAKLIAPAMPTFKGFHESYWWVLNGKYLWNGKNADDLNNTYGDNVVRVLPVQYGTFNAETTVHYEYDLRHLFYPQVNQPNDSIILDNLLSCDQYTMYFNQNDSLVRVWANAAAQNVAKVRVNGQLKGPGADELVWLPGNVELDSAKVTINDDENWDNSTMSYKSNYNGAPRIEPYLNAFKDSLNYKNGMDVQVAVNRQGINIDVFDYKIFFIKPLIINAKIDDAQWMDLDINTIAQGVDYNGNPIRGSVVKGNSAFAGNNSIDFAGYHVNIVKDGTGSLADQLHDYYVIGDLQWDTDNALTNFVKVGNDNVVFDDIDINNIEQKASTVLSLKQVSNKLSIIWPYVQGSTTQHTDELVFQNNSGSKLEREFKVFVPATITYKYGTEKFYVQIVVKPNPQK